MPGRYNAALRAEDRPLNPEEAKRYLSDESRPAPGRCFRGADLLTRLRQERTFTITMPIAREGARKSTPPAELLPSQSSQELLDRILTWLDDAKAESLVAIDIRNKSSIGDYMVIASGRSDRHVGAIADQVQRKLKESGHPRVRTEGQPQCDWVLIDLGAIVVHVFRPEVREFYNLEKMWSADRPSEETIPH